jgi:osmoprotectant transport system substrate-binding protein
VRWCALSCAVLLACLPAGCGSSDAGEQAGRPVVRLGTKNFTEQFILGHLYAKALEAKGFRVELKQDVGSSELVDRALTGGGIDMYLEYTGVIVQEIAGQRRRPRSAAETYQRAKAFEEERGFAVLDRTPGSDSLAQAVLPATARRHDLVAMGDLERLGRFRYGGPPENRLRFQGARGVRQAYGLDFEFVPLDIGRRYDALDRGTVDVVDVFTTEGQLADPGRYVVLRDPKGIFGYQNIVPVVNGDVMRRQGPAFARTLDAVSATLTNAALRRMNGAVDLRGVAPADVAERFLRDHRLL